MGAYRARRRVQNMHKHRECEDASTWASFFLPCFAYHKLADHDGHVNLVPLM